MFDDKACDLTQVFSDTEILVKVALITIIIAMKCMNIILLYTLSSVIMLSCSYGLRYRPTVLFSEKKTTSASYADTTVPNFLIPKLFHDEMSCTPLTLMR